MLTENNMPSQRKIFKNGIVLTLDKNIGNFMQADVLVEGTKIAEVGPNLEAADAEIIDASNMIVMPGFVDTHRHIWQGIVRNMGTDHDLGGYFANIMGILSPVYRPQDAYAGNYVSALGAIDAGVTTLLDWSHIQITPEHSDAAIKALQDSGMRSIFGYGTPNTEVTDWWKNSGTNHDDNLRRIATEYFSSKDQLMTLARAPRGPEFEPFETANHDWEMARSLDIRITVHCGVGFKGQHGKIGEMGKAGLLGSDTTYIHCGTLSDEEIQMIVDTGGTVSFSASVEMQMGHGFPPIQRFLDKGLRPSLSVDVETAIAGDMFTQMRTILSLQRGLVHDRMLRGEENLPNLLNPIDVLEFATIEGARANGLDHKVGTLTPGKEADIIMLRTNRLNVIPLNDPIGAVVSVMDTGNVDSVFVAGKALKRNAILLDVDLNRIQKLVNESRDYVVKTSGFTMPKI
jgi:cytosine/adenosine deaminase-related metal-dependent hydrolase